MTLDDLMGSYMGGVIRGGNPYLNQCQAQNNVYALQQQAMSQAAYQLAISNLGGYGLAGLQNTPMPERLNANGQTRRQWLAMVDARIGLMEASGIPISDSELAALEMQAAEWG